MCQVIRTRSIWYALLRYSVLVFTVWIATYCHAQAVWNNTSFVHRFGQQVVDGQNDPVRLNGLNLGGWLMWEGWIWGGGYTQQKSIYNNIESIVGTAAAEAFKDSVYKNFITRADIEKISQECYNVVRIPFNHSLLEDDLFPYIYKPEGWEVLDSVLKWCEDYNVYAVLDLHAAPGGQNSGFISDPDFLINLWNSASNQKRTKRLWKAIADRYKDRGIIAGYDLLNEPNLANDTQMVELYNDIIDSVRLVDNNHMIFLEGNNYAADFDMFTTLPDPNVCFEFHFYTWFFPNAIAEHLQPYTEFSDSVNAPIWCGEWGENNEEQLQTTLTAFNDPMFKVSGNAFWTWKKMKETSSSYPYYNGIEQNEAWQASIDWVGNAFLPQPTASEMQEGIDAFIHNIKLENCTFNESVSEILHECIPITTEKQSIENCVIAFPNPFTDHITINSAGPFELISLTDATGHLLWSGQKMAECDLSSSPAGSYFLMIKTMASIQNIMLVK